MPNKMIITTITAYNTKTNPRICISVKVIAERTIIISIEQYVIGRLYAQQPLSAGINRFGAVFQFCVVEYPKLFVVCLFEYERPDFVQFDNILRFGRSQCGFKNRVTLVNFNFLTRGWSRPKYKLRIYHTTNPPQPHPTAGRVSLPQLGRDWFRFEA